MLTEMLNVLKFRGYRGINFACRHQWNFEAVLLQVFEDRWILLDLNQRFLISSKIMGVTREKNPPSKEDSRDPRTVSAKGFTRINTHKQRPNPKPGLCYLSL